MIQSLLFLLLISCNLTLEAQQITLPLKPDSVRLAVIGDSGTGGRAQHEIAQQMVRYREKFPFEFVLMLGDNIYGRSSAKNFVKKFERPYQGLLEAGVRFYASLGNHDGNEQCFYKLFNMNGRRFYSFSKGPVRFFALDTSQIDQEQLKWLETELKKADESWKICFFHHPLYSSGRRHGSDEKLQRQLEPLFVKYGVNVVFSGHDHFYERIVPQKGIYYFVSGGAAKLRRGNIGKTPLTAKGFDTDYHFMLLETAREELHFQTISRTGDSVDSGVIPRQTRSSRDRESLSARLRLPWCSERLRMSFP